MKLFDRYTIQPTARLVFTRDLSNLLPELVDPPAAGESDFGMVYPLYIESTFSILPLLMSR